jgi:hypothetical protein
MLSQVRKQSWILSGLIVEHADIEGIIRGHAVSRRSCDVARWSAAKSKAGCRCTAYGNHRTSLVTLRRRSACSCEEEVGTQMIIIISWKH